MSQNSWTMKKGKMRTSWVWKMINDHYGVKEKANEHGLWGMKQIHQVVWKYGTQNMMVTYILSLRQNLEYFLKFILGILYTVSKLEKLGVQRFKWYANWSWNEEVIIIWRQLYKVEGPFWNSTFEFEIQLMNSKSNSKWPQFRIHPLSLWCFAPLPWELYLRHFIRLK